MTKISNQYSLTNVLFADAVNGRVGIGTETPASLLHLNASGYPAITIQGGATAGGGLKFLAGSDTYAELFGEYQSANNGMLLFRTRSAGTVAERMRITSAGNVGIGTSSPTNSTLEVRANADSISWGSVATLYGYLTWGTSASFGENVAIIKTPASTGIVFQPAGTERMRITSGGDVLISNTDGSGKLVIGGDDNNYILRSRNLSAGGSYQFYIQHSLANISMGNQRGTVAYNNSSDYRLKEDLKEFNGLDILSSINFYDFKWKQNQIRNYGVIAHELQEILPYVVEGKKDELFEDGSVKSQQVDITKLVPILGKAIQELSAKISLLENK